MGTLAGHLLPGSFFILFATWWGFITSIRFVQSRKKNTDKNTYKGTVAMPCICLPCRNMPLESYIKAVLAFIALLAEAYTGYKVHYRPKSQMEVGSNHSEHLHHHHKRSDDLVRVSSFELGNAQHITMYSAFILGSIVEIMVHHGVNLPRRVEYAMGIMAFSVEAFLFAFHLHGKKPLEVYVHVLLVYAIIGCIVFTCLEAYDPKQVLFTYGRILFTILQGTWFYQVGFMLYPPSDKPFFQWDLSNHRNMTIVTACFCWHVMLIIVGLFLQLWFVKRVFFDCYKFEKFVKRLKVIDGVQESDNKTRQDYYKEGHFGENSILIEKGECSDEDVIIDLNNNNNRIQLK
ncbi:transmembrane 45A [Brachionus plicatilis]|uniref:Transmembrane 45A n=1 Tax=Brachionus plicatilis TaxID=10195 RepID=A0A3M7R507_BRAPC|nr:transmembrane 45A [Brachionus plicatilis]